MKLNPQQIFLHLQYIKGQGSNQKFKFFSVGIFFDIESSC